MVNVYNAGSQAGAAGTTLDRMVNRGFKRGEADNAPAGVRARSVVIITDDKTAPTVKLVANQLKGRCGTSTSTCGARRQHRDR